MTGMHVISAPILDRFRMLRSFRMSDKGMDIDPEDETSNITQYQETFLHYVDNEYFAKHRGVPVNKHKSLLSSNLIPSVTASASSQSFFDWNDLSSDDEEYLTPNNVAETIPRRSDCAAHPLTAARHYLNSPPEAPKNQGQSNPNVNEHHPDPREISSTLWLLETTDLWCQQKEIHSKYADLSNVAGDISYIIPHGVRVEASFSLGPDFFRLRQSKTTDETLREKVVVRQFPRANNRILVGADPEFDTTNTENYSEIKKEEQRSILHRIAKVHNVFEMWQLSQNLRTTQMESHIQNKKMTAVGYIFDMETIVTASSSVFQHDGAAAFKLSERYPFPPPLSAKVIPGGQTQILNLCRIWKINRHPVKSDEDSAPESIPDTEEWLDWNGDLENPDDSEEDCVADVESNIEQVNSIEDP